MIVCHCNRIDHRDIERVADMLSGADALNIVTPVAVYKSLGKTPRCGGCLSLAANIIHTRKTCENSSTGLCPFSFDNNKSEADSPAHHGRTTETLLAAE